jgi:hypothetical protein
MGVESHVVFSLITHSKRKRLMPNSLSIRKCSETSLSPKFRLQLMAVQYLQILLQPTGQLVVAARLAALQEHDLHLHGHIATNWPCRLNF